MNELQWNNKAGWGFMAGDCDKDYWTEYRVLDQTPMGRVLTALRRGFVDKHVWETTANLVDVGIGGGAFVAEFDCEGIDINPKAIAWLDARGSLWDGEPVDVLTFWDSIEHIMCPGDYLEKARKWVFLSTPIYKDQRHCLASKHYKPGEHLWYFTHKGILQFMDQAGFIYIERNCFEDDAGREGIGSYAFVRRN